MCRFRAKEMLGLSRATSLCWPGDRSHKQEFDNRQGPTPGSLYTNRRVGGRIGKQRTQRGKGEAEEGLDFFVFKRFYSQ